MFEGKEILGKPVFSMQRGNVVIEDGKIHTKQGSAVYLAGDVNLTASAPNGHKIG